MKKIDQLYRELAGQMLPVLISRFGLSYLEKGEQAVLETFSDAERKFEMEQEDAANLLWKIFSDKSGLPIGAGKPPTDDEIKNAKLLLLFACCDEKLSCKSQLMLILKYVCGFKDHESQQALLISDELFCRKFLRGRTIVKSGTLLPSIRQIGVSKLTMLHTSIYLLYMEGYSALEGKQMLRRELCVEAMRLIKTILENQEIRNHNTYALMALMCFYSARFQSRVLVEGELLELEMQDRRAWDKELIKLGVQYLQYAHESNATSEFIYEAAIASVHAVAARYEDTNWHVIAGLYDRISEINSGPGLDVKKATAIFYAHGAAEALKTLQQSVHQTWLHSYVPYFALLGKIHNSLGNGMEAIRNYEKALSLSEPGAEFDFLKSKIDLLKVLMN
jgi:predicted RNA polymerase sigma factor